MRAAGESEADIAAALEYHDLYFRVVRGKVPFAELDRAARAAEEASWGAYTDHPQVPEHLDWWRTHHDFDMRAALGEVRVPVLALWGGRDTIVPPASNVEPFRTALPEETRASARLVVCPGADHPLECEGFTRDDGGRWVWPGLSSVAFEELEAFAAGLRAASERSGG